MDTIENPMTGEKIRVAKADFTDRMTWDTAVAACNSLGSGWRLPSKEELNEIFRNKDTIGGFTNDYYWSFTEYTWPASEYNDFKNDCVTAWKQYFGTGWQNNQDKDCLCNVRAVRDL